MLRQRVITALLMVAVFIPALFHPEPTGLAALSLVLWMLGLNRTLAYLLYHLSQLGLIMYSAAQGQGLLSMALPWLATAFIAASMAAASPR